MLDLIMRCQQCDLAYTGEAKRIVAGSREYVRMIFQLCPDWLKLESVAANFKPHDGEVIGVAVVDGVCVAPWEAIAAPGFSVWLVGNDANGVRIVSDAVAFAVAPGDPELGAGSGESSATIYELCLEAAEAARAANFAHEWNGTVLTVSSTSGTSSANLVGPQGPQGIQGIQGVAGPAGPAGPRGEDGKGVSILGSYSSEGALKAAHPTGNIGDAYLVAGELYVWDGSAWANVGNIQGPQGVPGEQGVQGIQGERGPAGPAGPAGPQGPQGERGPQGEQGGGAADVTSMLMVGDSWAEGWNGVLQASYSQSWPEYLASKMGCESWVAVREGGAGFVTAGNAGRTFAQLAATAAAGNYTCGVIVGGINDWAELAAGNYGGLAQGVKATANAMYARSNGKMRDIYFATFWGPRGYGTQIPRFLAGASAYMASQDTPYRFHVLSCWDAIMTRGNSWTVSGRFDSLHPNEQGYRVVAATVASALMGCAPHFDNADNLWSAPWQVSTGTLLNAKRTGSSWRLTIADIPASASGTHVLTSRMHQWVHCYGSLMNLQGKMGLYAHENVVETFGETISPGYGEIDIECTVSDPSGVWA